MEGNISHFWIDLGGVFYGIGSCGLNYLGFMRWKDCIFMAECCENLISILIGTSWTSCKFRISKVIFMSCLRAKVLRNI